MKNLLKNFPCAWQALLLLFACLVLMFFLGIASAIISFIATSVFPFARQYHSFFSLFTNAALMAMAFCPLCAIIFYYTEFPVAKAFRPKALQPAMILAMMVYVIGSSIVISDIDNLTRWLFAPPDFLKRLFESIFSSRCGSFILMVIAAPLVEELLFRGVILDGFLKHYSKRNAILLSALLFAIYHINPYQFVGAFVGGIVLAWIYTGTGSLLLCMLLHAMLNLAAWSCKFIPLPFNIPGFNAEGIEGEAVFQPILFDMAGVVFFISGLCLIAFSMRKYFRQEPAQAFSNSVE